MRFTWCWDLLCIVLSYNSCAHQRQVSSNRLECLGLSQLSSLTAGYPREREWLQNLSRVCADLAIALAATSEPLWQEPKAFQALWHAWKVPEFLQA